MAPNKQYPRMLYLTRDKYCIVKNEVEQEDAMVKGFKLHWLDPSPVTKTADRIEQIDSRVKEIDAQIAAVEEKTTKKKGRK